MYTPSQVPTTADALPEFLRTELLNLAQSLVSQVEFLQLQTLYAAPDKPRDGMVVKADGATWNPGSGSGFYGYRNAAWHLLG